MSDVKINLSQTQYKDTAELKKAVDTDLENKKYNEKQVEIFGDNSLKEGATKDDVISLLKENNFSDDVALGIWSVVNTTDDEIIDADEFANLLEMYGSDAKGEKAGEFSKVTIYSLAKHINDPRTGKVATENDKTTDTTTAVVVENEVKEADAEKTDADTAVTGLKEGADDLTAALQAEISAQDEVEAEPKTEDKAEAKEETEAKKEITYTEQFKNFDSKVKQDEDGQYYIETEKWDTNASDNLDCVSRIIYNTYGVSYKTDEGQAILNALKEANAGTPFENGLVYPNQKIILIDASEILGLKVVEEGKKEADEADKTDKEEVNPLQEKIEGLENVKQVKEENGTYTYEGVNADGKTVTYTKDANGNLKGDVIESSTDANGTTLEDCYHEDGTKTAKWYAQGSTVPYAQAECDAEGNRVSLSEFTYDAEGNLSSTKETKFAADGTQEVHYYNAQGVETDANGNVLTGQDTEAGTKTEAQLRNEVAELRAETLFAAMDRAGTDEAAVEKILNNVKGQDLLDVMNAFEQKYGKSLESYVKKEFSFLSGQDRLLGNMDAAKNYASVAPREEISEETILAAKMDAINAACDRHGTTESVLNDIILNSSDEDLQKLMAYYNANTSGKDFKSRVLGEVSFEQDKILRTKIEAAENYTPSELDAQRPAENTEEYQQWQEAKLRSNVANARVLQLHAAMDRAGTDEDAVNQIISGLTGQDLVDVMNAFEQKYGKSLESCIKKEFSFLSGQDRLLGNMDAAKNYASVAPRQEVSEQTVIDAYADALLTATTSRKGTDESVVYEILNNGALSDEQIVSLANTLAARGESLTQIIDSEFSGSTKKGLLERLSGLGIQ